MAIATHSTLLWAPIFQQGVFAESSLRKQAWRNPKEGRVGCLHQKVFTRKVTDIAFTSDFCNNYLHPASPASLCLTSPRPRPTRPRVPYLMPSGPSSRVPNFQVPTHASRCPRPTFVHGSHLVFWKPWPAVELKRVLSVTKHGFVFWAQRKRNTRLEIYEAFQDRLTCLNRHMIVSILWNLPRIWDCRLFSVFNTLNGYRPYSHSVIVNHCPTWSTAQNITQSCRKRCFPHDSWSCLSLYVFFLPLSTENTSTRSLIRSSLFNAYPGRNATCPLSSCSNKNDGPRGRFNCISTVSVVKDPFV